MVLINCKICGSDQHEIIRDTLRHNIKRNVLRCTNCSFVFLEPTQNVSPTYYEGKSYRQNYGPDLKKVATPKEIFETYLPFQERIINEFEEIIRPDMKVLDVGCSTGHFLFALKDRVGERVGVELNQDAVDFIRQNLDFKVYSEPMESVNIKEGPFDLITSLHVLEHVDDPFVFLQSIAKHLKSGGHLYLEIPNLDDALLSIFHVPGYTNFYYREPHLSYFSSHTMALLMKKAGFEGRIKTIQRYNFMNALNWIFTDKPQDNFTIGNSDPVFVKADDVGASVKSDLNDLIKKVDKEYKQLLDRHSLGEALIFLGKKK